MVHGHVRFLDDAGVGGAGDEQVIHRRAGGDRAAVPAGPTVDHVLVARSADPRVVKETHVTMYHVLWELVHVFFEQPGVLTPEVVA